MATSKSTINPISGLGSIDTSEIYPAAKEKIDPNVSSLALAPDSAKILANMQKRAAELTSPWHNFQTGLDEMVARTHYDPTQAVDTMEKRRANEAAELQNIGTTMSQVDLFRNQLKGMQDTFGKLSSGQNGGIPRTDVTQIDPNKGEALSIGINGIPIKLSAYDLQNLKHYVDTNDVAGFKEAFKQISNIRGKEAAQTEEMWLRPDAYNSVKVNIVAYDENGNLRKLPEYPLTVKEAYELKEYGMLPKSLSDDGYTTNPPVKKPKVQKKATGGIMKPVQEMSEGSSVAINGANSQPKIDAQQALVNPINNVATSAPTQEYNPSMLENALTALTGSGSAQAASIPDYSWSPAHSLQQQQGEIQSGLSAQQHKQTIQQEKNQAQLESEKKEREEAGMFVGKIGSLASTFDEIERRSNAIINHASKHPEEFAYKEQTGPYSYLLSGVEAAPFINGKNLEQALENIKAKVSGQDTINRRSETQGNADSLGIEYTQEKFAGTGARIGQGLTQIAQNAKNIGVDKPAKTNLINAYMIQATAGKYKDWAKAWQEYKKDNPKNPDPFTFQQSPQYKAVEDKWSTYLDQKLGALEQGKPKDGTKDLDKNGNPIIWKDGKPMRDASYRQ